MTSSTGNSTLNGHHSPATDNHTAVHDIPSNMSTSALESKLRQLQEQSNQYSQTLTQKLASSQSGQNLLHMGSSLGSLPPNLHSLLSALHPLVTSTEKAEQDQSQALQKIVTKAQQMWAKQQRVTQAEEAIVLLDDLQAAEACIEAFKGSHGQSKDLAIRNDDSDNYTDVDTLSAASLERAAYITLNMVDELQSATQHVVSITKSTAGINKESWPTLRNLQLDQQAEWSQFVLKLAPRIRRLESDILVCLVKAFEMLLEAYADMPNHSLAHDSDIYLALGHVIRGFLFLGRGKDVESMFARVAIMPLIRSRVSMGQLDEGGPRGECAGLAHLLQDLSSAIVKTYSPLLLWTEEMLGETLAASSHNANSNCNETLDLFTAGVWVPLSTALMADSGIRMAIFSPGIASVLQANYVTLDNFVSTLAARLLQRPNQSGDDVSSRQIAAVQDRIYKHPKTAEFAKKWNLPIYYQLRFGESCSRVNNAIENTRAEGWSSEIFSGSAERREQIKQERGFELDLFLETYDVLTTFWRPDVILRPLTNRFLRGGVQIVTRLLSFVQDGMDGKIKFGVEKVMEESDKAGAETTAGQNATLEHPTRTCYCWGDSEHDVAAVAWELTILESTLRHDYLNVIQNALDLSSSDTNDLNQAVREVLDDAGSQIGPIVDKAWNQIIVDKLTSICSKSIGSVKGVATTYRMTNRPPPTQPSVYVGTVLRPLKEFANNFRLRVPDNVGSKWKYDVVVTVTDRYATAVEELLMTVQRTEEALRTRRARRTAVGGMSDGDKVKLQLFLDYKHFSNCVKEVGVEPKTVLGIAKLQDLTKEGDELQSKPEQ